MDNLFTYVILVLLWSAYFMMHSIMASTKFKAFASEQFGISLNVQRIVYNVIAIVGLLCLLIFNGTIDSQLLIPLNKGLKMIAMFLAAGGVLVINASFKQYKLKQFLGFENEAIALKREGILAYVRHPLYSGTILMAVGFFFFDPRLSSLVSVLCILLYIPVGIYFEEKKLIKKYGEQYLTYRQKVPAIIPRINLFK